MGLKYEKSGAPCLPVPWMVPGVFPSELTSTANVKPGRWVRWRRKLCHASPWAPAAPQLLAPSCQAPGLQKPRCVLAEPPQQHRGERQQMPGIPASSSPPAAPCQVHVAGRGGCSPSPGGNPPSKGSEVQIPDAKPAGGFRARAARSQGCWARGRARPACCRVLPNCISSGC